MKICRPKMRGNLCFVELCASLIVLQDKKQCALFVCIKWNRTAGNSNCSHFVFRVQMLLSSLVFQVHLCVAAQLKQDSRKFKLFSFCASYSHVALESCASGSPACCCMTTLCTLTGVMQLLSKRSVAGLAGGRWQPLDIISSRISAISLFFSLDMETTTKLNILRTQFSLEYDYKYDSYKKSWCD